MNCFGIVRQEDFDGKPWHSLPDTLWSMKFCNTVNFQKQRMVSLQNVSVQWNQKFSTESRGTHPIFFLIVSDARKVLKDINVCLWKVLGPWNTTISTETRAIPSYAQLFSVTEISETLKSSPTKSSSTMRDKKKSMEECPTPSPIHKKKLSMSDFSWNTEGFSYEMFWYCEPLYYWRTNAIPPPPPTSLMQKLFRCQKFSGIKKCFSTKCFSTVRQRSVDRNLSEAPPPPLSLKFFDTRNFMELRSVHLGDFLVLWNYKKIDKHRDTLSVPRPLLYIN